MVEQSAYIEVFRGTELKNTGFFSKKQFLNRVITQLSTLVLKEDNSLSY